jgi:hypothetical protein
MGGLQDVDPSGQGSCPPLEWSVNRDEDEDVLAHLRAIREHLHGLNNSINVLVLKVELIRRFVKRLVKRFMA